ncbi:MAG: hypothetical protein KME64_41410 [Scytonematopsis contorta HA4267-MV1]|jgi:hypothetical protein|nr:hypothetical protein [Scytonematopsis contorta HA4267-MV1]
MSEINSTVQKVLDSADDKKKEQMREMILQMGIKPSDPLFNLYAELGSTQGILEQLPTKIQSIVVGWTQIVDDKLDAASDVAVQQQKSAISQAAKELLKQHNKSGKANPVASLSPISDWGLVQIGGVLGIVLALGIGVGAFTYSTIVGSVGSAASSVKLSAEDKNLLQWVKSPQGRLARKVYERNKPIIETCSKSKKQQGCVILVD